MKTYRGAVIYLHAFLTLALDRDEWSSHVPATLPLGKEHQYPLDRKLGGPWSQSGCSGKDKISLPLPGIEPQLSSP